MKRCSGCKGGCVECLSPLPGGKTCADCVHVRRCVAIFGQHAEATYCQWIPSRWLAKEPAHV